MTERDPLVRVLFTCSGVGIMNRGIESFFRDAFDGLKHTQGLDLHLLKGAGQGAPDEQVVWNMPRTCLLAKLLGAITGRNAYVVEQWSSLPSVTRCIRALHPGLIYYSDANLGFLLFRLRRWIGVPYRLLFSNGGPVHPPFIRTDYVHQVAPCYHQEALRAGEPPGKHFLLPYGIKVIANPESTSVVERTRVRTKLGLPIGRKIILSVGWIRRSHKRMHYVIEETARLTKDRPFLQLLGAIDKESREIIHLGKHLLGPGNFAVNSVPYEGVSDYYRAADCFVLASLQEGFGRVYLEALMHGLPVIAHRNSVTEHILGAYAVLADLTRTGALAAALVQELGKERSPNLMRARWQYVRERFSWEALAPGYRKMFEACAPKVSRGLKNGSLERVPSISVY